MGVVERRAWRFFSAWRKQPARCVRRTSVFFCTDALASSMRGARSRVRKGQRPSCDDHCRKPPGTIARAPARAVSLPISRLCCPPAWDRLRQEGVGSIQPYASSLGKGWTRPSSSERGADKPDISTRFDAFQAHDLERQEPRGARSGATLACWRVYARGCFDRLMLSEVIKPKLDADGASAPTRRSSKGES